ncbi:hypothetical protein AXX04_04735 [Pseudomonas aeruginosa]|uniref:hypothetical protein n=1 Tax=Pseudomonas aeruginosa TaxID=287 RepID=UPI000E6A3290|nr:hypothetical protein [Pseudomonas aeruginosa]RIZ44469.1 hypothetical protein AXX04_04735 [Pseudomonas aeruginosa]
MSIDWTKAPEGANKAGFTGPDNYLQFYRIPGMLGDYDFWSENNGWRGTDFPTCANHLFERPAKVEWDGQGLPPVGAVCEWHESDGWAYTESKVVAYTDDGLFVCMQKPGRRPEVLRIDNCDFRPIRTPEQIAAAERWAAIQQMLAFADVKYGAGELMSPKEYVETAVAALYDAGYRRQEEGK